MAVKVRIKNFQSLKDISFEIKGMTTITGQNNSGKTAIMRALRGVWENTACESYIRSGEAYFSVSMDFEDGQSVLWEKGTEKPNGKGGTINRYVINGVTYNDVGQGVPEALDALKITSVQASGHTLWPQIATQFPDTQHSSQVFLLDKTGPVIAEAIADVEKVGLLNRALKESETDRRTANAELKTRRKDESEVAKGLERFEGLEEVDVEVIRLEEKSAELEEARKGLLLHMLLREKVQKAAGEVSRLLPVEKVAVPSTERVAELEGAQKNLALHTTLRDRVVRTDKEVSRLLPIEKVLIPGAEQTDKLQKYQKALTTASRLKGSLAQAAAEVSRLGGVEQAIIPDEPVSVQDLGAQLRQAHEIQAAIKKAAGDVERYSAIEGVEFPSSDRLLKIQKTLGEALDFKKRLSGTATEVASLTGQLETAEKGYIAAGVEVDSLKAELGSCPLCGEVFGEGHLHGS